MNTITPDQLKEILDKHAKYLEDEASGECANLCNANLREADLCNANLRYADLCNADLRYANLREADLCNANLRDTNLTGADLDYSCLPLWCGSLGMKVDKRIAAQIAYHFCRLICDDPEVRAAQQAIRALANQFHRVRECGEIKDTSVI